IHPSLPPGFSGGGWLALPLAGAALAMFLARRWAHTARERRVAVVLAIFGVLAAGGVLFGAGPGPEGSASAPKSPRAKARAILKWSYRSPGTVARILPYAGDLDPTVREQAVLALGLNLIVTDIEHATPTRPARYESHPLRERLRTQLLVSMREDSSEAVRAEAARALWKAPLAFGPQPAAAETLAVVLERALRPGAVERLAWLALDAAAGARDPGLEAAAARFAMQTPDPELARAARTALER
ncbi:MAG TPA: hypothetical protein VEY91_13180, partial [Candidatus Limnocylindria bacterium]|nr:hypothetical protein [Candidatus Limnocylindria bacterium]